MRIQSTRIKVITVPITLTPNSNPFGYIIITIIISKCFEHQPEAVTRNKDKNNTIMCGMPVYTINIEKQTNQEKKSGSLSLCRITPLIVNIQKLDYKYNIKEKSYYKVIRNRELPSYLKTPKNKTIWEQNTAIPLKPTLQKKKKTEDIVLTPGRQWKTR